MWPLGAPTQSRPCTTGIVIIRLGMRGCARRVCCSATKATLARTWPTSTRGTAWIDHWHTMGVGGFYDQPSRGRPPRLNDAEQPTVYDSLQQSPKDVKQVVHALEQETSTRVRTKTIKRLIKKRYVGKRLRKVPAKAPDPHKDERSKVFMHQVHQ